MGVAAGPNVSKDNLVLYYDIANSNSFRGEPTTNLVLDPEPLGFWSVSNYMTSSATVTFEKENGVPHMKISSITNWGSSYPRIGYANLSATISTTFSISFEAKGTPDSQIHLSIYSAGSTKVTVLATLTNNWQRFEFPNTSNAGFVLDYAYLRPLTTGATQYIRKIQIETKTYPTAFISGTRGTTVATGGGIIDLSGNSRNGQLVNGPTFSSSFGGSLIFDGTDDYVNSSAGTFSASGITLSAFVYLNSSAKYSYNVMGSLGSSNSFIMPMYPQNGWVYFYLTGDDAVQRSINTTTCPINRWLNITQTFDGTTMRIYFDGILNTSSATSFTYSQINLTTFKIGQRGDIDSSFSGNIAAVSIYNRALTATEVLQNYNATRIRFLSRQSVITNGLVLNLDASNRDSYLYTGPQSTNELTWSEDFTNAIYTKAQGSSITANSIAGPFGNTSGHTLNVVALQYSGIYQAEGGGSTAITTTSVFAKAGTFNFLYFIGSNGSGGTGAFFNLSTGTVATVKAGYSAKIEDCGNGWYRCSVISPNQATFYWQIGASHVDNNYTPSGNGSIYIWGAQMEYKSSSTPYLRTGSTTTSRSSTTWSDLSGYGYNATLTNGPSFLNLNAGTITFDGVNDYVSIPNFGIAFGNTDFTIEFYLLVSSISVNFGIFISGSGPFNLNNKGCELRFQSNVIEYTINDGSGVGTKLDYNLTNVADGQWRHIVVTQVKQGTATLFVNATNLKTASYTAESLFTDTFELRIGRGWDGYLNGSIALFKVYNRALSSTEVLQNFNATKSRFGL